MLLRGLKDPAAAIAQFTVRQQIGHAAAALAVLIVTTLAGTTAYLGAHQASAFIRQDLAGNARVLADRLNRSLATRYREVRIFAALAPLKPLWMNDAAMLRDVLEDLQESYPVYSWIGFADTGGTVRAATGKLLEGVSVAQRPWFHKGLQGPVIEDVHEAQLLAKLLGERPSGEPFRFVDIAFPVQNSAGNTIGVLCAHLSWDFASSLREATLSAVDPASQAELLVLSREGKVLLGAAMNSRPLSQAQLTQARAERAITSFDEATGRTTLVAVAPVDMRQEYPGLGWMVVARQPYATAIAPVTSLVWTIVGIGVCIAIVGILLALFIAGRIARPIQALTNEAEQVGRPDGPIMLSFHAGSLDVVQLSTALRSLLRRVGVAEQRTQEAELRAADSVEQYRHDIQLLRRVADTDPLTNLMNRRAFLAAAEDALEYFRRYERALAVLVIDIDHFKLVNDTYGHAAGDGVIKRVGELIEQALRSTDKVGRFGGEEFVVLLREIDEIGAHAFAKRIVENIASAPIGYGRQQIAVTVSVGAAVVLSTDVDIQATIERADRALYMAKSTGRNRSFLMPAAFEADARKVA